MQTNDFGSNSAFLASIGGVQLLDSGFEDETAETDFLASEIETQNPGGDQ